MIEISLHTRANLRVVRKKQREKKLGNSASAPSMLKMTSNRRARKSLAKVRSGRWLSVVVVIPQRLPHSLPFQPTALPASFVRCFRQPCILRSAFWRPPLTSDHSIPTSAAAFLPFTQKAPGLSQQFSRTLAPLRCSCLALARHAYQIQTRLPSIDQPAKKTQAQTT